MQQIHERVLATAAAGAGSLSTRQQLERYGPEFLAWCEDRGAVFTVVDAAALREAYLADLARRDRFATSQQRKFAGWIVNRLAAAADLLAARAHPRPIPEGARTQFVDGLVPNSRLDRIVQTLLDEAPSPRRRAVLRCHAGQFLAWCRETDLDPEAVGLVELEAYRAWIRARGRRAESPLVVARKIVRAIHPPAVWW